MKTFIPIFVLIFISASFCCSEFSTSANLFNKKSRNQILEITSNFKGSWWMNGQVLDFRLYDDGNVEYDEYQTNNSQSGQLQAKSIKNTKRLKLNEIEFQTLLDLLNTTEFSKIAKNISQQKTCIDAFIDTKIVIDSKFINNEILIKSHCSNLADSKSTKFYFKNFPSSLNRLFEVTRQIKNKESVGKFYN